MSVRNIVVVVIFAVAMMAPSSASAEEPGTGPLRTPRASNNDESSPSLEGGATTGARNGRGRARGLRKRRKRRKRSGKSGKGGGGSKSGKGGGSSKSGKDGGGVETGLFGLGYGHGYGPYGSSGGGAKSGKGGGGGGGLLGAGCDICNNEVVCGPFKYCISVGFGTSDGCCI